jgi:hypothetical protein
MLIKTAVNRPSPVFFNPPETLNILIQRQNGEKYKLYRLWHGTWVADGVSFQAIIAGAVKALTARFESVLLF